MKEGTSVQKVFHWFHSFNKYWKLTNGQALFQALRTHQWARHHHPDALGPFQAGSSVAPTLVGLLMLGDLRPRSSSCKSAFQASSTKALLAPDIASTLSLTHLFSLPPPHSIPNTLLPTLPPVCFQSPENRLSVNNICFLSSNTNLLSSKLAQNSGLEERVQWKRKEGERNISLYDNNKHWGKCGGVLERPYYPKTCSPLAFKKYFLSTIQSDPLWNWVYFCKRWKDLRSSRERGE